MERWVWLGHVVRVYPHELSPVPSPVDPNYLQGDTERQRQALWLAEQLGGVNVGLTEDGVFEFFTGPPPE